MREHANSKFPDFRLHNPEVHPEPAEKPSYFERCFEHGSKGNFAVVTGDPLAFVTGTREKAGTTPCV